MNRLAQVLLAIITLGLALFAWGCQSAAGPTAEIGEATATEEIVYEIVTPTPQPVLPITVTPLPTATKLATFTPIAALGAPPTRAVTQTAPAAVTAAVKGMATATPAATASPTPVTPTQVPIKYAAPQPIKPGPGDQQSDGSDIQFYFNSVGVLNPDECYLVHYQMININAPSKGPFADEFVDQSRCGDATPAGRPVYVTLYRPKFRDKPNYGTIESITERAAPTDLIRFQWYVAVVLNYGLSADGVHYDTARESSPSAVLEFDFVTH